MKQSVIIAYLLFMGATSFSRAQETTWTPGAYAAVNIEYGTGSMINTLGMDQYVDVSDNATSSSVVKPTKGTFGGGLTATFTPGFMLSENMAVELGISYYKGSTKTVNKIMYSDESAKLDLTAKANQLRLTPALMFRTSGDLYAFSKIGIVLPIMGKSKYEEVSLNYYTSDDGSNMRVTQKGEYKNKFSMGFVGAIGAGYALSSDLSLSLEIAYTALNIKPKSRTITSHNINGREYINDIARAGKETEFVKELNGTSNNSNFVDTVNPNAPYQDMADRLNFSQIGLSVGIKYFF